MVSWELVNSRITTKFPLILVLIGINQVCKNGIGIIQLCSQVLINYVKKHRYYSTMFTGINQLCKKA